MRKIDDQEEKIKWVKTLLNDETKIATLIKDNDNDSEGILEEI